MSQGQQQQGQGQQQQQESAQSLAESLLRGPVTMGEHGAEINDTHDAWRFANVVWNSGLAPKGFKNVAAVMIAVMMGAELGMTPMASIQNIAVINNRPSLWGDIMLALCRQSGKFDEEVFLETYDPDLDGGTCFCQVRRKPDGKTIIQNFSMEDAKVAKLLDKDTPWKTYPRRMLMFRARSWALRDAFGDVLLGLRSAEEERDIPSDNVEQSQVEASDDLRKRLEEATAEATKPAPKSEPDPIPKKPRKPEPEEAEAIAEPEPPYNPPTPAEVADADKAAEQDDARARRFDEYVELFAQADASTVARLSTQIDGDQEIDKLTRAQWHALCQEITKARERLSKA